jgi:hypothetical protein
MSRVSAITKNKKVLTKVTEPTSFSYRDENSDDTFGSIEELGDFIAEQIASDFTDFDISDKNDNRFSASIQTVAYCCGIPELGDLRCNTGFTDLSKVLDRIASSKNIKGKTVMMNLNGVADCKVLSAALNKCVNWTKVKTFKNANSKNTIEIWLSNNE